jgi:hypothetical protein
MHAPYVSVLFKELNIVLPPPDADLLLGMRKAGSRLRFAKTYAQTLHGQGLFLPFTNREKRDLTGRRPVCNHWLQYEANRSQTHS